MALGVGTCVGTTVGLGVAVGRGVGVAVGNGVGVSVGKGVGDGVSVGSGVGVLVGNGVGDGVSVGSGVGVSVGEGVGVGVSLGNGVAVSRLLMDDVGAWCIVPCVPDPCEGAVANALFVSTSAESPPTPISRSAKMSAVIRSMRGVFPIPLYFNVTLASSLPLLSMCNLHTACFHYGR